MKYRHPLKEILTQMRSYWELGSVPNGNRGYGEGGHWQHHARGTLVSPATGTATALKGFNSNPRDFIASVSNASVPVNQTFRLQAEPAGNHTAAASGTLNLLYAAGAGVPAETGLKISSKGLLHSSRPRSVRLRA